MNAKNARSTPTPPKSTFHFSRTRVVEEDDPQIARELQAERDWRREQRIREWNEGTDDEYQLEE